jgi:hypothetical protein
MQQIEELLPQVIPAESNNFLFNSRPKPFALISVVPTGSFAFKAVNLNCKVDQINQF